MNLEQFSQWQQEFWQAHFALPHSSFGASEENRKRFAFYITTDSIVSSVYVFRWRWVIRRDEIPDQSQERIQQQRQEALDRKGQWVLQRRIYTTLNLLVLTRQQVPPDSGNLGRRPGRTRRRQQATTIKSRTTNGSSPDNNTFFWYDGLLIYQERHTV